LIEDSIKIWGYNNMWITIIAIMISFIAMCICAFYNNISFVLLNGFMMVVNLIILLWRSSNE